MWRVLQIERMEQRKLKIPLEKNKYVKEVISRKKVDVARIFVIPKQEAIRAD